MDFQASDLLRVVRHLVIRVDGYAYDPLDCAKEDHEAWRRNADVLKEGSYVTFMGEGDDGQVVVLRDLLGRPLRLDPAHLSLVSRASEASEVPDVLVEEAEAEVPV